MECERVLLTGAGGMLGHAVYPYFRERYPSVVATDLVDDEEWLEPLDVRDAEALRARFEQFRPDLVLHLAACTDLEFCEVHAGVAESTNARGTASIAALCQEFGATLVYISTAGIFDGCKDGYYSEADAPNPIMVYGRTKWEGEEHVRRLCRRHFIVRAGWMVGGGGDKDKKFVQHIVGQVLAGKKTIRAVNDRWGTPTYTHDFALNLFRLLGSRRYGTYHMVCEGSGTRFDVARHVLDVCGRDDINLVAVDSDYFADRFFAPRPRSEMLINSALRDAGLNFMRPWQEALRDYLGRYFSHAFAGAPAAVAVRERRKRSPERRRTAYPWTGRERRQSGARRSYDAAPAV